MVRGSQRRYASDAVDFFAILVVPELAWYIIPAELILGKGKVGLYPNSPKSRYAPYREAWHFLRPRPCAMRGTIDCIQACADPTVYFAKERPMVATELRSSRTPNRRPRRALGRSLAMWGAGALAPNCAHN